MKNKYINVDSTIGAIAGFIIGFLFFLILKYISNSYTLSKDNIISLIAIVLNIAIAGFVVVFIQRKFSDRREVKNFIIDEIKQVQSDYKGLSNKLLHRKIDGRTSVFWFKIINTKITQIQFFLKQELEIEEKSASNLFIKYRNYVTKSESFNNSYSLKEGVELDQSTQKKIIEYTKDLNHNILNLIIKIHKK